MSSTHFSMASAAGLPPGPDRSPLLASGPHRQPMTRAGLARRRLMVAVAKRLLPLAALALLASVVLWPELTRDTERTRLAARNAGIAAEGGQLTEATYHGVDERGRPFTVTADSAQQTTPERVDLTMPKGDLTLESGNWVLLQSRQGVYRQQLGALDLSGDVQLYRDDGTTMQTDSAAIDLKAGAVVGAEMVHAEGSFGTLDAQGFSFLDRGAVIQFTGPGRLILNGNHS
jgi:lipopolysaccharide export system protein LptC